MNKCLVEACDASVNCKGYCSKHYARFVRYGNPLAGRRFRDAPWPICSIDNCDKKAAAKGYCVAHYARAQDGSDLTRPLRPRTARIGDRYHAGGQGYYMLVVPKGTPGAKPPTPRSIGWRMLEHRYVMQHHLGRPLLASETVHHLNGDRSDNRLENLELWSSAQPPGQSVTDKLKWAREIIGLYSASGHKWPIRYAP